MVDVSKLKYEKGAIKIAKQILLHEDCKYVKCEKCPFREDVLGVNCKDFLDFSVARRDNVFESSMRLIIKQLKILKKEKKADNNDES